jgi:hypothetical protein
MLGPHVAHALIQQIAGLAARSELDVVADPLRKMIFRQREAKSWLDAALLTTDFPAAEKVGEKERKMFLEKLMTLRGGNRTNQAVKEFWLLCRGSDFAYAS